jgi:hypothetical protein
MAARIATPGHWREAKKAVRGWSSKDAFPIPRSPSSRDQKDNDRSSIMLIVLVIYDFPSLLSFAIDNKLPFGRVLTDFENISDWS